MTIDPRGQRFAAAVTSVVLALVLLTASGVLLAAQAAVFATAVLLGVQRSPYALIFRYAVRPRIGPPRALEAAAPPRFAQGVGLGFAVVGTAGYFAGALAVGMTATAFALFAAFLNAAFGFCLGCEIYLAIRRASARLAPIRTNTEQKEVSA